MMTLADLAAEVQLTPKTLRQYIHLGELRATRTPRGRLHATFTISRDDADSWLAFRALRRQRRTLPSVLQKGTRLNPQAEHMAFSPNHDDETMGMAWIDDLKAAALRGDEAAKLRIQMPFGEGGLGVKVWQAAGIGGV